MGLVEDLKKIDPERNVVCNAVNELGDPDKIREFFGQYITCLRDSDDPEVRAHPEEQAYANVRWILGHCDDEAGRLWAGAIPGLYNSD